MVRRHLIDCISVIPFLQSTGHTMDVGSGAGLPGIVIKILLPSKRVTLLESRRRRANFLRHVIRALKLVDVSVLEDRVERLTLPQLAPLDETIARAFTHNDAFLSASARLLPRGGRCLLMHGPRGQTFLDNKRASLNAMGLKPLPAKGFTLPFGGEERTVLFFEKS